MRTAVAFLASLAAASAFAPLPSYTRSTAKMTGPVCATAGSSPILQPFAERRALKVLQLSCEGAALPVWHARRRAAPKRCTLRIVTRTLSQSPPTMLAFSVVFVLSRGAAAPRAGFLAGNTIM